MCLTLCCCLDYCLALMFCCFFVCLPEENLSANKSSLILEPGKQIGGFLSSYYMVFILLYRPFLHISIKYWSTYHVQGCLPHVGTNKRNVIYSLRVYIELKAV